MHERPPNQCRACGVEWRGPAHGYTPYRPRFIPGLPRWMRWLLGVRPGVVRWTCRECGHFYDVEV